jgi:hypothetical protein
MLEINTRNIEFERLLKASTVTKKISLFFASKTAGEDFDPKEKNYLYSNLNPATVKGYVRDIKPEKQYWRQYGISEGGAKEIYCDAKYAPWFRKANKIKIEGDEYSVYSKAQGNRVLITEFPFKLVRIIVFKE